MSTAKWPRCVTYKKSEGSKGMTAIRLRYVTDMYLSDDSKTLHLNTLNAESSHSLEAFCEKDARRLKRIFNIFTHGIKSKRKEAQA